MKKYESHSPKIIKLVDDNTSSGCKSQKKLSSEEKKIELFEQKLKQKWVEANKSEETPPETTNKIDPFQCPPSPEADKWEGTNFIMYWIDQHSY